MPNDEIVTKIEELKKACDPNENEATLVHELKQINEKIMNIQNKLSELKNIPDVIYYDDIQESRDTTRKAELNKQIIELEKKLSFLEMELKDLKTKEEEQHNALEKLQQNKNKNVSIASTVGTYEESLESSESKENWHTILTEVKRKVDEDTKAYKELETRYKEIQAAIEKKATLIKSIKENIKSYQKQLEQISTDLVNREKYVNHEKKNSDLSKIADLEKELQLLTEKQAQIVENPIMLISLANKAALEGDLITILNKIKGVKELLLQKPFMDIPEDSIQEQILRATEERDTFFNQISGKDYTSKGLPAADERIDEINAYIAKWLEEVNTLKERKNEIDNGSKYGSARKINEIISIINAHNEEVAEYENKENLTADEEVALDKRKKEIEALRKVLNSYFADQSASIEEAKCIENNIKILKARIESERAEIKDLKKMSKSLAGIDIMAKKKDSDALQERVNKVMDLKKLPEYRRTLGIVDEILDLLGKDIVVPTIEEKEEELLVTGENEIEQPGIAQEDIVAEIHPIEDVKEDKINIEPPLAEVKEEVVNSASTEIKPETSNVVQEKNDGVVFEPAFKEEIAINKTSALNGEMNKDGNQLLNQTANRVVATEEIKSRPQEVTNPFANISELRTVESESQKASVAPIAQEPPKVPTSLVNSELTPTPTVFEPALKVENQEKIVVEPPVKESIQSVSVEPSTRETIQQFPTEPEKREEVVVQEPSTSSIDAFFADQWGQINNDNGPTLGKVA